MALAAHDRGRSRHAPDRARQRRHRLRHGVRRAGSGFAGRRGRELPRPRRRDPREIAPAAEQRSGARPGDRRLARRRRASRLPPRLPGREHHLEGADRLRHARRRSETAPRHLPGAPAQRRPDRGGGGRSRAVLDQARARRGGPPRSHRHGRRRAHGAVAHPRDAARRHRRRRHPGQDRSADRHQERRHPGPRDPDRSERPALGPLRLARSGPLRVGQGRAGGARAAGARGRQARPRRHLGGRAPRPQDDAGRPGHARRRGACPGPREHAHQGDALGPELCRGRRAGRRHPGEPRHHRARAAHRRRRAAGARRRRRGRHRRPVVARLLQPAHPVRRHLSPADELHHLPDAGLHELPEVASRAEAHPLGLQPVSFALSRRGARAIARQARARRRGARHDRAVQRRARLHDDLGALQERSAGADHPDEPLPHPAHQRHHRPQGHHRQIYRRRHHGVLERAAARRGAGSERLRGGARHAGQGGRAQPRAPRGSHRRRPDFLAAAGRDRRQHGAVRRRQHGLRPAFQLFGARRYGQRGLAAGRADENLRRADHHRRAHGRGRAGTGSPCWRWTFCR